MARLFNASQARVLNIDSAVLTGPPITAACWFGTNNIDAGQVLLYIGDSSKNNQHFYALSVSGDVASDPVTWTIATNQVSQAATSIGITAGATHHACGISAAADDHRVFIDGGSKGTNTDSRSPASVDRTSIGALNDNVPGSYHDGGIAEVAVWNVALSDAEVALLAKRVSPLMVRPNDLVAYWPLLGRYSPEIDLVGGFNMTVTGATVDTHPRMFYIPPPRYSPQAAAAAAITVNISDALAISLAAQAARISAGVSTFAQDAAIAVALQDPRIATSARVAVSNAASVTLMLQDLAAATGISLSAEALSVLLAAQDALQATGKSALITDPAAVALALQDLTTSAGVSMAPDTTALLVALQDPQIAAGAAAFLTTGTLTVELQTLLASAGINVLADSALAVQLTLQDALIEGGVQAATANVSDALAVLLALQDVDVQAAAAGIAAELRHSVFRRSGVSLPLRTRDADRRVGSGGVSDISVGS